MWRERSFYAAFHRRCFALVGHRADDGARFHDLLNGHRDRLPGHIFKSGKPSFAELLFAAGVVEVDDDVRFFGLKISGRIVEGEMPILTNADESDLDRRLANQLI